MDLSNTTQTSLSDPTQPTPSQNKPPFVYFLIGTITVILVVVVSFVAGKRVASPVTTNAPVSVTPSTVPLSPTPDPTAKWKTYRNEKLKIEFMYPNDWDLQDNNGTLPVFLENSPFPSPPPDGRGRGGGFPAIEIELNRCPEGRGAQCHESLEDRKTRIIKLFDPQGLTEKKVHISSKLGLQLSGLYGQGMLERNYFKETSVDYLNTILVFTLYRKQHETIYDQILSTLRFVDNNSDNSCPDNLLFFENDVFTICHPADMTGTNNYYNPVDRSDIRAVHTVLENSTQRILITTAFTGGWGGGYETQTLTLAGFPVTLLSAKGENNKTSNLVAVINMEERTKQFPVAIDFQKKSDDIDLNLQRFKEIVNSFRLK